MPEEYKPVSNFRDSDIDHSSKPVRDFPSGKSRYAMEIYPDTVNFGAVRVGQSSLEQVVMVRNTGYAPLSLPDLKFVGPFALSGSQPRTLQPNEQKDFKVVFSPTGSGEKTGGVYINTGDAKGEEFCSFSGLGVAASFNPSVPLVRATNEGGTSNSIAAATLDPVPATNGAILIALPIRESNTASPVTVSFNNNPPLTIKNGSGEDITVGMLDPDMVVIGYVLNGTFRLIIDEVSAAAYAHLQAQVALATEQADRAESEADRAEEFSTNLDTIIPPGGANGTVLQNTPQGRQWNAVASAEQGELADTAVQPDDPQLIPAGGTTGQFLRKLSEGYGWGSAATPEQGALADSALQSDDIGTLIQPFSPKLTAYSDLVPYQGTTVLAFENGVPLILDYNPGEGGNGGINSWVVVQLTSDGENVSYDMGLNPGHKNNTFVNVNGVYQRKSSYEINNNIITFNDIIPAAGYANNIEIVMGRVVTIDVSDITEGAVGTAELANLSVSSDKYQNESIVNSKYANGSISRNKLQDEIINAALFSTDPGDIAAIRNLLGIKRTAYGVAAIGSTTDVTTTNSYAGAPFAGVVLPSIFPNSKMVCRFTAEVTVSKPSDSIDDLGASMILAYSDGSTYVNINSTAMIVNNNNVGATGIRQISVSVTTQMELSNSLKRPSQQDWAFRCYANVTYSGNTLAMSRPKLFYTEVEN